MDYTNKNEKAVSTWLFSWCIGCMILYAAWMFMVLSAGIGPGKEPLMYVLGLGNIVGFFLIIMSRKLGFYVLCGFVISLLIFLLLFTGVDLFVEESCSILREVMFYILLNLGFTWLLMLKRWRLFK